MKNSEKMIQEMDDLFEKLGMKEEMAKLAELLTDSFMIRGDVTEDLKEALQRAPDDLLEMIWENTVQKEPDGEIDRAQKEETLYHAIYEDLEKHMVCLEPEKIKLLIQVAYGNPVDIMDMTTVNDDFVPRGWVFNFVEGDSCVSVVMNELHQILQRLKEPEIQERYFFAFGVRKAVAICLELYGIVTQEQFGTMFDSVLGRENSMEIEIQGGNAAGVLDVLEEQGMFWREDGYIISPHLQTKAEYRELLREQGEKEYYMPDSDTMKLYIIGNSLEKTPEYETVYKCLMKELKDSDMAKEMLEEIADHVVREEWSIPEIMDCLYQWDVTFDHRRTAYRLVTSLSEWLYIIRRWSERGHSRKEMGKENEELQYVPLDEKPVKKAAASKIYPNDPCPCGSGKKYKKCCGK